LSKAEWKTTKGDFCITSIFEIRRFFTLALCCKQE